MASARPRAARSAATSFCRTSAAVSATGSEPRVPQNRTRFMAAPEPRGARYAASAGRRARASASSTVAVDVEDAVEAADREDLRDQRCSAATSSSRLRSRICLAAIISTRRPTLLMYSTPEKSSTSAPSRAAAGDQRRQRCFDCAALRWSTRPTGVAMTVSAK